MCIIIDFADVLRDNLASTDAGGDGCVFDSDGCDGVSAGGDGW